MKTSIITLLASTALIAVPAAAQTQSQQRDQATGAQRQSQQAQQPPGSSRAVSDQEFARRAAIANLIEIETSELALKQARSEDVRNFAQQMVEDHQDALNRLRNAGLGLNVPYNLEGEYRDFLRDLRQAGRNFDREYIDFQIEAHQDAIQLFQNYARAGGNNDLRQYAQRVVPTLREHLKMAQNLSANDPTQTSQRPSSRMNNRADERQQRASSRQQLAQTREGVARAQIRVEQQPPQVTVDQAQPRIIVRQPPPVVTIERQQPEIIVRMPAPDVNVAASRPEVYLNMPEPRVSVNREGRERVRINRAERPQVEFEHTGEPRVRISDMQGRPRIRYEQVGEARDQNRTMQRTNRGAEQRDALNEPRRSERQAMSETDRENRRPDAEATEQMTERTPERATGSINQNRTRTQQNAQNETTWVVEALRLTDEQGAENNAATAQRRYTIGDLLETSVYNARGQDLGTIERIVADANSNQRFVVLSSGGFLGLFEDEVAIPVQRVRLENGRLIIRGLTEQDIEAMLDWEDRVPNHRDLPDTTMITVSTAA